MGVPTVGLWVPHLFLQERTFTKDEGSSQGDLEHRCWVKHTGPDPQNQQMLVHEVKGTLQMSLHEGPEVGRWSEYPGGP